MAYLLTCTSNIDERLHAILRERQVDRNAELLQVRMCKPELTPEERDEAQEIARVKGHHQANAFINRIYDERRSVLLARVRELKRMHTVNIVDVITEVLEAGLPIVEERIRQRMTAELPAVPGAPIEPAVPETGDQSDDEALR